MDEMPSLEAQQAQMHAEITALHRIEVLRRALYELDPSRDHRELGYSELLHTLEEQIAAELNRLVEKH
jgi:hypothetical protein